VEHFKVVKSNVCGISFSPQKVILSIYMLITLAAFLCMYSLQKKFRMITTLRSGDKIFINTL